MDSLRRHWSRSLADDDVYAIQTLVDKNCTMAISCYKKPLQAAIIIFHF